MHILANNSIEISRRTVNGTLLVLVACVLVSCGRKKQAEIPVAPQNAAQSTPAVPVVQPPKEKPVYVYSGDRFRDPFMPAGQSASYQPDAIFDPQRAVLRGIIFGQDYKTAVLNVGGTGSYFIKDGRIFDIMGKTVEGFSAKIFVDKVLILGEADNVFELKIKNNNEEAKPL